MKYTHEEYMDIVESESLVFNEVLNRMGEEDPNRTIAVTICKEVQREMLRMLGV
jgi:hypothetical protein